MFVLGGRTGGRDSRYRWCRWGWVDLLEREWGREGLAVECVCWFLLD